MVRVFELNYKILANLMAMGKKKVDEVVKEKAAIPAKPKIRLPRTVLDLGKLLMK